MQWKNQRGLIQDGPTRNLWSAQSLSFFKLDTPNSSNQNVWTRSVEVSNVTSSNMWTLHDITRCRFLVVFGTKNTSCFPAVFPGLECWDGGAWTGQWKVPPFLCNNDPLRKENWSPTQLLVDVCFVTCLHLDASMLEHSVVVPLELQKGFLVSFRLKLPFWEWHPMHMKCSIANVARVLTGWSVVLWCVLWIGTGQFFSVSQSSHHLRSLLCISRHCSRRWLDYQTKGPLQIWTHWAASERGAGAQRQCGMQHWMLVWDIPSTNFVTYSSSTSKHFEVVIGQRASRRNRWWRTLAFHSHGDDSGGVHVEGGTSHSRDGRCGPTIRSAYNSECCSGCVYKSCQEDRRCRTWRERS